MKDRRQHARVSFHTEIWLDQDGISPRTARPTDALLALRDLSEGGALVATTRDFPVGGVLHISFRLPGARDPIVCRGVVRNVRDEGATLGVQFLDVSEQDRLRIRTLVAGQASGPPIGSPGSV